jgi:hypothetical protein
MSEQHITKDISPIGASIVITVNFPSNLLESSAQAFDNYIKAEFNKLQYDFIDNAYKIRHAYNAKEAS